MCGFAGVLLINGNTRNPLLDESLVRMSEVIRHRGPDDSGTSWNGPCGMTHRRLSVIDLSRAGRQPMGSEDGSVMLAYNGEVYNFLDLKSQFGLANDFAFRSATDTEVILHLYEKLGVDFLSYLNGMFSLAIWDSKRGLLVLARDPFGIKPLFYMRHQGNLWFASEIKSLLQAPSFEAAPDAEALFHYLAFNYIPERLTAFEGIRELAPGTVMEVKREQNRYSKSPFFKPDYSKNTHMDAGTAIRQSHALLRASVKRQLISDVPVGVMLSGGMDSSSLAALMRLERGDSNFHTFSLAFDEPSFDESAFAREMACFLGTIHHEVRVTPEKVMSLLPGYLAHIDEPYGDGSAIPTWLLAEEAASFVTVLLSGEGGDEVFSGYDTHAAMKARKLYRMLLPGVIRKHVVSPLANLLPVSMSKLSFEFRAKRFTRGAELCLPESHLAWRAVLTRNERLAIFPGNTQEYRSTESFFNDVFNSSPSDSDLSGILRIDAACHLPHDLMIKNDRMTMAHSIEARVPFTDLELFRMLASVPDRIKMPGMRKKHLLRKAMRGILPPGILSKKKVGLEMPYSSWFRGEMKDFAYDSMFSSKVFSSGLLNPQGVLSLWKQHQEMKADNGRALWGILNYACWYDIYIGSKDYLGYIRPGTSRRHG